MFQFFWSVILVLLVIHPGYNSLSGMPTVVFSDVVIDTVPVLYKTDKEVDVLPLLLECDKLALSERERYFCSRIKFKGLIEKNLDYPRDARYQGIEGTVSLKFVVTPDGRMTDLGIHRDIGSGCGQAVLDAVKQIPSQDARWSPGSIGDSAVHTLMYVPIKFDLEAYAMKHADKPKTTVRKRTTYPNREIFKVVEQMPRFPGCEHLDVPIREKESCAKERMLEFIYGHLAYPDAARIKDIEGMVVAQFIVNKDGMIEDVNIVRDIGGGCGAEAQRIIESMNHMEEKWIPGHQRERTVEVLYTLPIKFKLD